MAPSAEQLKNEGNRLLNAGQVEAAAAAYRAALEVDPAYVPALNNLGLLLKQTGQRREGESCLRRAIAQDPADYELHNNLAVLLHEEGRLDEALASYGAALRLMPDDGYSNGNYGGLLSQLGRSEEAIDYCRRAAELCPDTVAVWSTLAKVLRDAGQVDAALPVLERARHLPGASGEQLSAYLSALIYPPAMVGGQEWPAYAEFDREHVVPRLRNGFQHQRGAVAGRKIRLGYVSGALRSHATYFFIVGVLAQHDHVLFEVFVYDTALAKDALTARLIPYADHYADCAGLVDRVLAERLHADRLDLLIDLDGHIGHNAQLALAWKPAPRQFTWLGFPHSSGSSAIDGWLSDRHITGPGFADPHCEQLALLPDFYMVFDPGTTPPVSPLPASRRGFLTFGSFNAPNKLNDDVLRAWAQVVLAVPDAQLLIAASPGPHFEQRVATVLEQAGLARHRVRFARACLHPDFLALHGEADVALDPFPVNGTTTSLFGLWMGVPLLTVAGTSHRARVGLSLLENLGLAEWIAATPADLPQRALALTGDLARLAELRAGLRQQMAASPLCDSERFTRALEAILADSCRQ